MKIHEFMELDGRERLKFAWRLVSWGFTRVLLGFLSLVAFLPTAFIPVWVDRSERTMATVGETI